MSAPHSSPLRGQSGSDGAARNDTPAGFNYKKLNSLIYLQGSPLTSVEAKRVEGGHVLCCKLPPEVRARCALPGFSPDGVLQIDLFRGVLEVQKPEQIFASLNDVAEFLNATYCTDNPHPSSDKPESLQNIAAYKNLPVDGLAAVARPDLHLNSHQRIFLKRVRERTEELSYPHYRARLINHARFLGLESLSLLLEYARDLPRHNARPFEIVCKDKFPGTAI